VVRGTISGLSCVAGMSRALKRILPFALSLPRLPPPSVEGFVALDGAYPSSSPAACLIDSSMDDVTLLNESNLPSSGGSSVVGKGGEDAKRDAIWTSAVWLSGEPMTPF